MLSRSSGRRVVALVPAVSLVSFLSTVSLSSLLMLRRLGRLDAAPADLPGRRMLVDYEPAGVSTGRAEGSCDSAPAVGSGSAQVAFRVSYDGSGTPLVLVHGWGQSSDASWLTVMPRLDAPFAAVDLPGHGSSSPLPAFSFESTAAALEAVVRSCGWDKVHVVAHSMGGAAALSFAAGHPDLVEKVTLVGSSAFWGSWRVGVPVGLAPWAVSRRSPLLLRRVLRDVRNLPEYAEALVWSWRARPSREVLTGSAGALRRFDASRWDLAVPLTWVVPADDRVVPSRVQVRSAALLGGPVHVVKDAGHSFFIPDPDRLVGLLR